MRTTLGALPLNLLTVTEQRPVCAGVSRLEKVNVTVKTPAGNAPLAITSTVTAEPMPPAVERLPSTISGVGVLNCTSPITPSASLATAPRVMSLLPVTSKSRGQEATTGALSSACTADRLQQATSVHDNTNPLQ